MASALIVYLRKLLRFTNYLLLFYGLAIVIIACEFYFEWIAEEEETNSSSNLVVEETKEEECHFKITMGSKVTDKKDLISPMKRKTIIVKNKK